MASHEAEGYRVIEGAIRQVYPEAVAAPSLLFATTDTRHYIDLADNQYRFHGAMVATADAKGVHGTDEQIGVESFRNAVRIAVLMLRDGAR